MVLQIYILKCVLRKKVVEKYHKEIIIFAFFFFLSNLVILNYICSVFYLKNLFRHNISFVKIMLQFKISVFGGKLNIFDAL